MAARPRPIVKDRHPIKPPGKFSAVFVLVALVALVFSASCLATAHDLAQVEQRLTAGQANLIGAILAQTEPERSQAREVSSRATDAAEERVEQTADAGGVMLQQLLALALTAATGIAGSRIASRSGKRIDALQGQIDSLNKQ